MNKAAFDVAQEEKKMKVKRFLIGLFLGGVLSSLVMADEGMWMPHQMKDLNLQSLGLRMNPADLYKEDGTGLMSAVISLGGATAEFVSAEGLILTNHHVAFGALQRASSAEKDYIKNGFLARTKSEEIPAAGYVADVLLGYEEVTPRIEAAIRPNMSFREIYEAIEKAEKEIIADAEKGSKDLRCTIARMYSGNRYYLFRFKRIRDVRLVYAPPQDLGNFGGEVDNWMWPRHTCDFSFLRAYVAKDGSGAEYSPDNIPYQPKSFLKISLDGVKEGDFTFVMGYPGRTYRNLTLAELRLERESLNRRVAEFKDIIDFYEKVSQGKRDVEIKYASRMRGLLNSLKNYRAKLEGMERAALFEKKEAFENEFLKWVSQDSARQKQYGDILRRIEDFMGRYADFAWRNESLTGITGASSGSTVLSQGYLILRAVEERQKPDAEREPAFQERNLPYLKQNIQLAERGYDLPTDRAFLKHQLKKFLARPAGEIPAALQALIVRKSEMAIEEFVDSLYNKTILADPQKRLELLMMSPPQLRAVEDPVIEFAAELEKELKALREQSKSLQQERAELKKTYEAALLERYQGKLAPDANGTIRFTYGRVEGYRPRDAVLYRPVTTLRGVMEKDTGSFPFYVPERLKELYRAKDFGRYEDKALGDIPCCFLNTTNVTGGNSGSPTLNAGGELVGIIFDMTYESVIGDYYVVPELQRSISVDIRYVLFIAEKFSGATHILKELGI